MTVRPTISVAVLNHNYGHYVGRAIRSALEQEPGEYELAELLVIDDGSTDNSLQVFADFPDVRVVAKPHEGFGPTLTRAVTEASGDWIAFLDADDWFEPNKLRAVSSHLQPERELRLIQHAEHVVDASGALLHPGSHPGGATSTLLVRRNAALDLLPVSNELFFHLLGDVGHGALLAVPLTRYRVHPASMTDRRTPGAFQQYMAGVCRDVAARLDDLALDPPAWASAQTLGHLSDDYRVRAIQHEVDAGLQRGRRGAALRASSALLRTGSAPTRARNLVSALHRVAAGRPRAALPTAEATP